MNAVPATISGSSGPLRTACVDAAPIALDAKSLLVVLGTPYFLVAALAGQLVFVMLRSYSPRGDIEREWLGRAAGWYIVVALGWMIGSTLVLFASAAAAGASLFSDHVEGWLAPVGGITGVLAALLGKSSATPARGPVSGWRATVRACFLAHPSPDCNASMLGNDKAGRAPMAYRRGISAGWWSPEIC